MPNRTIEEIKADIADNKNQIEQITKTKPNFDAYDIIPFTHILSELEKELLEAITEDIPLSELEGMCKAREEKRLVELRCKVGDTVYFIKSMFTFLNKPQDCQIKNWSMYANGTIKFVANYKNAYEKIFFENDFGKTVFLTLAEAEKKLEENAE